MRAEHPSTRPATHACAPCLGQTLKKLHREASAAAHMNNLQNEMSEGGGKSDDMSIGDLIKSKALRKQLLVGVIIKIGVQFSGIDAIFYYSTMMFRHAKVQHRAAHGALPTPCPFPSVHC